MYRYNEKVHEYIAAETARRCAPVIARCPRAAKKCKCRNGLPAAPFMATLRNGPLTIYATNGAQPETIEVEGGFAEVNEAGLTVLAEHIAG